MFTTNYPVKPIWVPFFGNSGLLMFYDREPRLRETRMIQVQRRWKMTRRSKYLIQFDILPALGMFLNCFNLTMPQRYLVLRDTFFLTGKRFINRFLLSNRASLFSFITFFHFHSFLLCNLCLSLLDMSKKFIIPANMLIITVLRHIVIPSKKD